MPIWKRFDAHFFFFLSSRCNTGKRSMERERREIYTLTRLFPVSILTLRIRKHGELSYHLCCHQGHGWKVKLLIYRATIAMSMLFRSCSEAGLPDRKAQGRLTFEASKWCTLIHEKLHRTSSVKKTVSIFGNSIRLFIENGGPLPKAIVLRKPWYHQIFACAHPTSTNS